VIPILKEDCDDTQDEEEDEFSKWFASQKSI
jgi:hypothetical protein